MADYTDLLILDTPPFVLLRRPDAAIGQVIEESLEPALPVTIGDCMPPFVVQADHRTEAEGRLLRQFEQAVRLRALVRALVGPLQAIEGDAAVMSCAFGLTTAEGAQLDVLGAFVGVRREGRGDVAYRAYVQARIFANASDGTKPTLYKIARALLGEAPTVRIDSGHTVNHPAHVEAHLGAGALSFPWDTATPRAVAPEGVAIALAEALFLAVSAGISLTLFYQYTSDATTFYFSSVGDAEEASETQGLADDSDMSTQGGALIGVEERA